MKYLNNKMSFPDVSEASEEGLLAVGGDLSVDRLLEAYRLGIFPWFSEEEPVLWWSPDPRFVLFPEKLKVSKSMRQILRNADYEVTVNKDFKAVITACSLMKRAGQEGTWITKSMLEAYVQLHNLGYAKSVEVWKNGRLVAGLYGIDLNNGVFCGESMFSKESNASKFAFISYVKQLEAEGIVLIDCQVYTEHLESLGAEMIDRDLFKQLLYKYR